MKRSQNKKGNKTKSRKRFGAMVAALLMLATVGASAGTGKAEESPVTVASWNRDPVATGALSSAMSLVTGKRDAAPVPAVTPGFFAQLAADLFETETAEPTPPPERAETPEPTPWKTPEPADTDANQEEPLSEFETVKATFSFLVSLINGQSRQVSVVEYQLPRELKDYPDTIQIWMQDGVEREIRVLSQDYCTDIYLVADDKDGLMAAVGYVLDAAEFLEVSNPQILVGELNNPTEDTPRIVDSESARTLVMRKLHSSKDEYDTDSLRPATDKEITDWITALYSTSDRTVIRDKALTMRGDANEYTKLISYLSKTFTAISEVRNCVIMSGEYYYDKAAVMVDVENSEVLVGLGDYELHLDMAREEENPEFYLARMAAVMMLSLRSTSIPLDRAIYEVVNENGTNRLYRAGLDGEWLSEENTIGELITPDL